MADIAIFRINYKSDFILTLQSDAGWAIPFCIKFWTGAPSQAYFVGYDGTTYTHCAPVEGEPTKLVVQFDDHHLPIGDLKFQIGYHFTVADFPTSVEDEVLNQASVIIEVDDAPAQVMLDLNGETAPEIEFSLPAYANEAQRIANEEQRIAAEAIRIVNEESRIAAETIRQQNEAQRISNEESRVEEFAQMKQESETATSDANAAATLANEKASLAADKAALADDAATLANAKAQLAAEKAALADAAATLANYKAALAQQKAEYAQTQGDYAKAQGDYAKQQGEIAEEDHERAEADHTRAESDHATAGSDHTQAGTDHTRAESDHATASADHTQAGQDHTRAESDHTQATSDHTQAGTDHTRAESDHTRAESDHAAVELYVDSLGAFDISAYHATGGVLAKYADLTAALGTNGANIPEAIRKGGMSVKYAQSSDNKYIQYRLMSDSFNTTPANWQGVDEKPDSGSNNLIKSSGVADAIGKPTLYKQQSWVNQNGHSVIGTLVMKAGHTYKATLTGTESYRYYKICSGAADSTGTIYMNLNLLNGVTSNTQIYTATEDITANIVIEGAWAALHTISLEVLESNNSLLWTDVQNLTNEEKAQVLNNLGLDIVIEAKLDSKVFRGSLKAVWCASINFDNTNHKVVLDSVLIANPNNNASLTIDAQEVEYTFSTASTNAWWFVYDVSNSTYAFKSAGTTSINDVVIACVLVYGTGTTNGRVDGVYWCAVNNWSINGVNVNTRITDLNNRITTVNQELSASITEVNKEMTIPMGLLGAKPPVDAVFTVRVGTIYNGKTNPDDICLCSSNFIAVTPGTKIECVHAEDISIRLTEYSSTNEISGFIKSTGYAKFDSLVLDANTKYVKISANYSERGASSSNPVVVSDFQEGDFGLKIYKSQAIENLQSQINIIAAAPISSYEDGPFWIDGSTWKAKTNKYAAKIIPVTGGGRIICTAGSSLPTRIAFANTYDPATIVPGTTQIDGLGNQNTSANTTRIYTIPSTCTYIVLNSKYGGNNSLPVSLIIDGKEYMKNVPDALVDLTNKVTDDEATITDYSAQVDGLQVGTFQSIIGRNIHKDAAVRAVGKKAVSEDILPLSFIHISDIHTKADNYKCFENACEFYEHYSNIKFMIATGDLVWDSYADQTTWYDLALQKTTKPVLNVVGNHDAGQYKSAIGLASQSSDIQCYEKYIAPYVENWGVVQPADAATEGKSYYYKDFLDEKVRLIVLNEFETDYEINQEGTGLVYNRETRAMRQAQVTWLIDTLTNTPSDYGVIVAYHQPDNLASEDNEFVSFDLVGSYRSSHGQYANIAYVYCDDKEWLPKILNAFATKSSLTLTVTQTGAVVTSSPTLVCDCDFTNVQAEFICILNGHTHRDYIGHLTNFPALKVLCVGADNLKYTSGFQPRAEGTPSEDLFNVVNIDRNRKTIKIIRIGSDASVTGQVRDQMIMSYATT